MSTPLSELLTAVSAYGTLKAVKWLEGEEEMALPEEELTGFAARRDIEDHDLTRKEWDQVVDTYLESVKTEMARRLTGSDLGDYFSVEEKAAILQSQVDNHDATLEQMKACHRSQVNLLREKLKDCESALAKADAAISQCHARMDSEKAASSVVPAPLVPEVVKALEDALKCVKPWIESADRRLFEIVGKGQFCECGCFELAEGFRNYHNGAALELLMIENALTALRNYSLSPSPSVELLREANERLQEVLTLPNPYTFNEQVIMRRVQEMVSKLNAALA